MIGIARLFVEIEIIMAIFVDLIQLNFPINDAITWGNFFALFTGLTIVFLSSMSLGYAATPHVTVCVYPSVDSSYTKSTVYVLYGTFALFVLIKQSSHLIMCSSRSICIALLGCVLPSLAKEESSRNL